MKLIIEVVVEYLSTQVISQVKEELHRVHELSCGKDEFKLY